MSQSKTVLDSGILAVDFGLQVVEPGFFVSGTWESGLQSLMEFRILWAVFWIPKLRIPNFTSKNFPASGTPSMRRSHTAIRQQFVFYPDLTRMTLYNILHSNGNTLMGFWHDCLLQSRHVHAWVHMAHVPVHMTHVPVSLERSHSRNSCAQFATQSSASVFHTWNTREGREFFRFLNVILHIQNWIFWKKKTIFQALTWRNKLKWSLGKNPHYHSLRLILKYGFELAKLTRLSRDGLPPWNEVL